MSVSFNFYVGILNKREKEEEEERECRRWKRTRWVLPRSLCVCLFTYLCQRVLARMSSRRTPAGSVYQATVVFHFLSSSVHHNSLAVTEATQFSLTHSHTRHTRIELKMNLISDSQTQRIQLNGYIIDNWIWILSYLFRSIGLHYTAQSLSTNYSIQWWFHVIVEFQLNSHFSHIKTFTLLRLIEWIKTFLSQRLTFVFQFLMSILFHLWFLFC